MKRIEGIAAPLRPYTAGSDKGALARIAAALERTGQVISLSSQAVAEGYGNSLRYQAHRQSELRAMLRFPELRNLFEVKSSAQR